MPINTDTGLRDILSTARVIAVVGHSDRPNRVSYQIGRMLKDWGYIVYPVNPTIERINGDKVYPSLADVPEPVDIVNVFRRSEYLEEVVDDSIGVGAKVVWAQLGIADDDAARKAEAAGLQIVQNRCIKVDYMRLMER